MDFHELSITVQFLFVQIYNIKQSTEQVCPALLFSTRLWFADFLGLSHNHVGLNVTPVVEEETKA